MKSVLLAGNGSFLNHGCEAIALGTIEILRKSFGSDLQIRYAARDNDENCRNDLRSIPNEKIDAHAFLPPFKKYSKAWVEYQINRFGSTGLAGGFRHLEKVISEVDAVVALGGDNYSFDYGYPEPYIQFDRYVLAHRKPLIYWGLSVGPFSADKRFEQKMISHLSRISTILARETGTATYLRSIGIEKNVHLVADPAFVMRPVQPDPSHFSLNRKGFIGINISTTVGRMIMPNLSESDPTQNSLREDTLKTNYDSMCLKYADIVASLHGLCNGNIVFIPHVIGSGAHSDYEFMKQIAAILESRGYSSPLVVPPYLSAPEYKWIISQAKCFIGARTHTTIAAFSSGVPTISLSYSLKARGLTRDMYGTDEFCISGKEVNPKSLLNLVKRLLAREDLLREQLQYQAQVMNGRAFSSGNILTEFLSHLSPLTN